MDYNSVIDSLRSLDRPVIYLRLLNKNTPTHPRNPGSMGYAAPHKRSNSNKNHLLIAPTLSFFITQFAHCYIQLQF